MSHYNKKCPIDIENYGAIGPSTLSSFLITASQEVFFPSQAKRAGNRKNLEARKKLLLFLLKHGRFGNFNIIIIYNIFYSGTHLCLCISAAFVRFKKGFLICYALFLKFTFDNFTSPVRLAIPEFYLPGSNFTSLGHRACTIFRKLDMHGRVNQSRGSEIIAKLIASRTQQFAS